VFAVVKTGGKQYKVQVGETLDVEKLTVDEGAQVRLDEVLLAANDGNVAYGRPLIDGAVVTARVVRQHKGPKLIIFKYKSKSRYRRRTGHRQWLTQLLVQAIDIPGLGTDAMAERPRTVAQAPVTVTAPQTPTVTVETAAPQTPTVTVETATTTVETTASRETGPVRFTATPGSAAPAGDALPAIAPTAQLDMADMGATTLAHDLPGDATLPTTLPSEASSVEGLADLPGSGPA
jgi:large subunit ribosomal protein L21